MNEFRLPLTEELGKFLKRERTSNHLTLKQLSKLSGVSECEISRIERSERVPNVYIVGKLERALEKL